MLPHDHFLNWSKLWYQQLMKMSLNKLATGQYKNTFKLKDKVITAELKMLHSKFVVVPIYKAKCDVAFVWQR